MAAREELQEFSEEDLKPLAGLMKKAQAADPNPNFGIGGRFAPTSFVQGKPKAEKLDPDEVDKDGKSSSLNSWSWTRMRSTRTARPSRFRSSRRKRRASR